jgi:uncharacterized membrane protein
MPYHRDEYRDEYGEDPAWPGPEPSWAEGMFGALSYLGAIVTGPILPLLVYMTGRNASEFVRIHAAQALNVTLTLLLYAISGTIVGVMLSFDSRGAALAVMIPIAAAFWVITVVQLVRGSAAAVRGEFHEIPPWICASLVA